MFPIMSSDYLVVFKLVNQCLSNSTRVLSLNPTHGEVYSKQHYVIQLVSDFRQDGGFPWVLQFPPPIKLTARI